MRSWLTVLVALAVVLPAIVFIAPTAAAQRSAPAGCYATYLQAYPQWSSQDVQRAWNRMSAETLGVCRADKPTWNLPSGDCRFAVELGTPSVGVTGWLCWYGSRAANTVQSDVDAAALRRLVETALASAEVQRLLGPGRHVIEFEIGGDTLTVTTDGTRVVDVQGRAIRPPGCYETYLPAYPQYAAGKASWDAFSAQHLGVCRMDPPNLDKWGDCSQKVELGAGSFLCWWGKRVSVQSSHRPVMTVKMSKDAFRTIVNARDPANAFLRLLKDGKISIKMSNVAKQATLKIMLRRITVPAFEPGGGRACGPGLVCVGTQAFDRYGGLIGHTRPTQLRPPPAGSAFQQGAIDDLYAGYSFSTAFGYTSIQAGINNVFNTPPPKIFNGFLANSDAENYDFLGRYFYVGLRSSL